MEQSFDASFLVLSYSDQGSPKGYVREMTSMLPLMHVFPESLEEQMVPGMLLETNYSSSKPKLAQALQHA